MFENRKLYATLAAVGLLVGLLATALIWGTRPGPVSAAPSALIAIKSVSTQEVAPGQTVSYSIVVMNDSGTAVSNLKIGDHLDALLGNVVPPSTGWIVDTTTPGYITFTLGSLAANTTVTATFTADLSASAIPSTVVSNTAVVSSDIITPFNTNTAAFTVSPAPDLQIYSPENGAVVTERPGRTLTISGRAWAQFDPAPFPDAPVLEAISNFGGAGNYTVAWSVSADAAHYVLQESKAEDFSSPTTYAITAPAVSQFVTGKTAGIYYYRVAAYNAANRPSRWSNVQTVTVTATSALSSGAPEAVTTLGQLGLTADATIAVSVSVDGGTNWYPASLTANPSGWWEWSYDWTLPEAEDVQYPLIARAAYLAGGETNSDTVTVTLDNSDIFIYMPIIFKRWPPIPYAPVLNDITASGSDFTVTWSYSEATNVPDPTEYQLEQATDSAFSQNVVDYTVAGTARNFTNMSGNTYFYRVRARNTYGYGEWSNVKYVQLGRSYDFTSGTQGWHVARADEDDYSQTPQARVSSGQLYHLIWGRADASILSPMETAPSLPYTIQTRVDIIDSEDIDGKEYAAKQGMTYGIIFGGNGGSPCPALRTASGCLSHYYRILVTLDLSNGDLLWSLKRIDYHDDSGSGRGTTLVNWKEIGTDYSTLGWNTWEIKMTNASSDNIIISVNGDVIAEVTDDDYIHDPYFGTFAASPDQWGAIGTKWDYFTVR